MTRAALAAGFPDSSSYYRRGRRSVRDDRQPVSPRRRRHRGNWTTGDCALGRCLVAQSERGVCAVLPGDNDAALLDDLRRRFPNAELREGDPDFCQQMAEIFAHLDDSRRPVSLPLDLQGTAFQLQVWQALRQIPVGETRSYRRVAEHIGQPRAVRAVAGACAANSLAVIVPCHRVVREDGALSGYRWGTARKAQLLAREAQHEEE